MTHSGSASWDVLLEDAADEEYRWASWAGAPQAVAGCRPGQPVPDLCLQCASPGWPGWRAGWLTGWLLAQGVYCTLTCQSPTIGGSTQQQQRANLILVGPAFSLPSCAAPSSCRRSST